MLKRLANLAITGAFVLGAAMPMASQAAVTNVFNPGSLIKGSGAAVYYFAENGKRYVFPNENPCTR